MPVKKKYTKRQIAKFFKACEMFNELAVEGAQFYLASGTMHLMAGDSHDENCHAQQDNIVESVRMRMMDGGDW